MAVSAYTQTGRGGRDRFAAALTRTLTAARMSSSYITAETDWREKPFRFITALETAAAGSEPTLLANATPMSQLNLRVGVWKNASPHFTIFPSLTCPSSTETGTSCRLTRAAVWWSPSAASVAPVIKCQAQKQSALCSLC